MSLDQIADSGADVVEVSFAWGNQKIEERVLAKLQAHARSQLRPKNEGPSNEVCLTDREISKLMGVSARSVQRGLSALRERSQVTIKTIHRRGLGAARWFSVRKVTIRTDGVREPRNQGAGSEDRQHLVAAAGGGQ